MYQTCFGRSPIHCGATVTEEDGSLADSSTKRQVATQRGSDMHVRWALFSWWPPPTLRGKESYNHGSVIYQTCCGRSPIHCGATVTEEDGSLTGVKKRHVTKRRYTHPEKFGTFLPWSCLNHLRCQTLF